MSHLVSRGCKVQLDGVGSVRRDARFRQHQAKVRDNFVDVCRLGHGRAGVQQPEVNQTGIVGCRGPGFGSTPAMTSRATTTKDDELVGGRGRGRNTALTSLTNSRRLSLQV